MNEPQSSDDNGNADKELDSHGMEHTDVHIAAFKGISCRVCRFNSNNKVHNHLKLSPCLKTSQCF